MRDAGWDHWVLSDVDHSGGVIIATPHGGGPLTVRAFPGLEVLLSIDAPSEDEFWDYTACFASEDLIVNKLIGPSERLVAIDLNGEVHDLAEQDKGWLIPAADNTWLSATAQRSNAADSPSPTNSNTTGEYQARLNTATPCGVPAACPIGQPTGANSGPPRTSSYGSRPGNGQAAEPTETTS